MSQRDSSYARKELDPVAQENDAERAARIKNGAKVSVFAACNLPGVIQCVHITLRP
jgi:hypothetical protein